MYSAALTATLAAYTDSSTALAAAIAASTGMMVVGGIISYLITALTFFGFAKKINLDIAWIAFIPIAQFYVMFKAIGKSMWNILWLLVPIADVIFAIYWQVKLLNAFGKSGALWLLNLIPGVGSLIYAIYLIYMAFSSDVKYVGAN